MDRATEWARIARDAHRCVRHIPMTQPPGDAREVALPFDDPLSRDAGGRRLVRAVLVVDVVESVRLVEEDEPGAVRRWREIIDWVQRQLLPRFGGRLVKSLGDGMMIEFENARALASAAFVLGAQVARFNHDVPPDKLMLVRMGAHVGELLADGLDLYGRGVNLAARLTTLAGPMEIVVSPDLREQLVGSFDAEIEDLGECHLKHIAEPVRAYRIGPPGPQPILPLATPQLRLLPTVCVIPFAARIASRDQRVLGEVIADEIILGLSRSSELNVVSRMSTTVLRDRAVSLDDLRERLHADYVVCGNYRADAERLQVTVELSATSDGRIVWAERFEGSVSQVAWGSDELLDRIVGRISACILARELERVRTLALPSLESHTLLIAGIALLHRLSRTDFAEARRLLEAVVERAPRQALPRAWLARWHVWCVHQGWSEDPQDDRRRAQDCAERALDLDPSSPVALTSDGLARAIFTGRLDQAEERYAQALRLNPNDSLAWLLKGTLHAFRGEGIAAVEHTQQALRLSPLDPIRWYYDSLAAAASVAGERYDEAITLARQSLKGNRLHTSTWRTLVIAQALAGRLDDARRDARLLLELEPGLTVSQYRARSPASAYAIGQRVVDALRAAGVPED